MRKSVGEFRGSRRRACCSGREARDTSAAKPACARQPSSASCFGPTVERFICDKWGECERCNRMQRQLDGRRGYRNPCRVAVHPAAGRQSSKACLPDTWHRGNCPAPWRRLRDRLDRRASGLSSYRFLPDRWDWGRCPLTQNALWRAINRRLALSTNYPAVRRSFRPARPKMRFSALSWLQHWDQRCSVESSPKSAGNLFH